MASNNYAVIPGTDVEELVLSTRQSFESVLSDKALKFEREAEFAIQILCKDNFFKSIAVKNKQAVRDAVNNVAAIGLTLNPAMKLAYLAPREQKIQLLISYMGLVHIAISSGAVRMVKTEIVRERDSFKPDGVDRQPIHTFNPFVHADERGPIVGVYVVAKTEHGDYLTDTMTIEDICRIRDRSESWKAHVASLSDPSKKTKSSPWLTDFDEMAKKTVIKRAYKLWPRGDGRLATAIDVINNSGEGLDLTPEGKEAPADFSLSHFLGDIEAAETIEDLNIARRAGQQAASRSNDKASYDKITSAAADRRRHIRGNNNGVEDAVIKENKP